MAIVPDSEWRTPILIGAVSTAGAVGAAGAVVRAGAAGAAGAGVAGAGVELHAARPNKIAVASASSVMGKPNFPDLILLGPGTDITLLGFI
jgi:hypothetical protein